MVVFFDSVVSIPCSLHDNSQEPPVLVRDRLICDLRESYSEIPIVILLVPLVRLHGVNANNQVEAL